MLLQRAWAALHMTPAVKEGVAGSQHRCCCDEASLNGSTAEHCGCCIEALSAVATATMRGVDGAATTLAMFVQRGILRPRRPVQRSSTAASARQLVGGAQATMQHSHSCRQAPPLWPMDALNGAAKLHAPVLPSSCQRYDVALVGGRR